MIINQNTQTFNDENQLVIATKEQEGNLVASGGANDLTCLVDNGELAVKVVNIDGEAVASSKTSPEVLTDSNQLANNTLAQDGDVLASDGVKGITCLVDNDGKKQLALKTFPLDGDIVSGGATDKTCLVEVDGKKQLALKILGGGGSKGWDNKPESWPDIRENTKHNAIRLLADDRYPLGFKATVTGGYSVDVDGKKYGDYNSDAQCSFTTSDWAIDEDLPVGYKRVLGYTCNNDVLWQITNFHLRGSDTVKISFSVTAACNVWGCYQGADATDNYDLYVSTTSGSKYLRYGSGTYLSYWSADNLGQRFDVTFSPTGTSGMPQDSTWTEKTFESANDFLVGSTTLTGTSSKLKGNLYGNIEVVGRLNLIPCERLSDNVLGYYDTVSNTFYEPTGTPTSMGYDTSHLFSYPISYPTGATKAHIVDIYPQTEGNDITVFTCQRVGASGQETQGVLWEHFTTTNLIQLTKHLYKYNEYYSNLATAVTAKGNVLKCGNNDTVFYRGIKLEYIPTITADNNSIYLGSYCQGCSVLTQVSLKKLIMLAPANAFNECYKLEEVKGSGIDFSGQISSVDSMFKGCRSLKKIPNFIKWNSITNGKDFITEAKDLQDTVLDVRDATGLKAIGCYGSSSYFMTGLKGLRVSSSAPFNGTTTPQINVSYTGMDRTALVQLFNDLPTVTNGQIIGITGTLGSENLTEEEVAIATNKGWTVTGGPVFELPFTQPVLTADGTLGGDDFAVSALHYSLYNAYKPFSSSANSNANVTWAVKSNNADYTFYNPDGLKVSSLDIVNRNENTPRAIESGTVYGSNDGTNWTELTTFTNDVLTQNGAWTITVNSNAFYKYHKINCVNSGTYIGFGKMTINATYKPS